MRTALAAVSFALLVTCCTSKKQPVESPPLLAGTSSGASSTSDTSTDKADLACPSEMVHVVGEFCTDLEEVCLFWVDATGKKMEAPKPGESGRCGEFQKPTRCKGRTVHKDYCIDRYEAGSAPGQTAPSWISYYDAERLLKEKGKRICTQSEWTFACEGPEAQPYPYGDGYHRDRTACNFDNPVPKGLDVFKATSHDTETAKRLDEMLKPSGAMARCVSPFGVHDQVGNLDEWVINESGIGHRSGLQGGHVFGVRSRCRPITEGHGPGFSWYETTYRGCKDPSK